jgi:hypothetical protein
MNALELGKVIEIVENPSIMLEAFKQENFGASQQLHREANRALHNYLCAVSTFIDHSRNFMKEFYSKTRFGSDYDGEIQRRFDSSEHARFVRDLRNYITHRGLPDSKLEFNMTPTGEKNTETGTPVHVDTRILYDIPEFLEWDGWTAPAKRLLTRWPRKQITPREIYEPHWLLMEDFNKWFEGRFKDHHKEDYRELKELLDKYQELREREGLRATGAPPLSGSSEP